MSVYKDLSTGTLKTLLESHFLTEYEEYDILMELIGRGVVNLLRLSTEVLKTLLESDFLTEYEKNDILMELEARGDVELLREEYYH